MMLPIVTYSYHLCWIFETNNQYPKWPCRLWHMNREASNIAMFKESVPMVPSGVATWPKGSWPKRVWRFSKAGERETVPRLSKTIQAFPRLSTYVSSYSDYPRLILALHCRRPRMQTAAAGSRPEPVGNCDGLCCGTSSRFGTSQHEVGQHPKVAIIGQDIPSWIRPNSFIAKQRVERSDGAIKVAKGCKGSLPGHQETTKTWNYQKLEVCFVVLDCSLTFSLLTLALESSFS